MSAEPCVELEETSLKVFEVAETRPEEPRSCGVRSVQPRVGLLFSSQCGLTVSSSTLRGLQPGGDLGEVADLADEVLGRAGIILQRAELGGDEHPGQFRVTCCQMDPLNLWTLKLAFVSN